ncbi:hypothetical protein [Methylomagnum sp.]
MKIHSLLVPAFLLGLMSARLAHAADPSLSLPEPDRRMIDRSLGKGVVGQAVPAPVIDSPAKYFRLAPSVGTFQIVHGPGTGHRESFRLAARPYQHGKRGGWTYQTGEQEIGFLEVQPDGGFVLTGVEEIPDQAITRYEPAEPMLLKGIAPGEERRSRMSVRVYDADDPDEVKHEGVLSVHHRYLGAYRLTVPAGTYDAVAMKSTFSGHVGPAELEDTQYRFFSREAGLVAAIEYRHVSAFLLYNADTKVGKVLVEPIH